MRETTAPQVISHYNLFRSAGSTVRRPGVQLGTGARGDGGARHADAAAGDGLRVVRAVARGDQGRPPVVRAFSDSALLLVYLTLAAQYRASCCRSSSCSACRWRCWARWRRSGLRGLQRRLLPDRAGHADRPGREERDPDRRVRRAAARSAGCRHGSGDRGRAHPAAADSDDVAGVHPRRAAAGVRDRARAAKARNSVGTAVAGGMLVSTFLNLIFIPVLYVVVQTPCGARDRGQPPEAGHKPHKRNYQGAGTPGTGILSPRRCQRDSVRRSYFDTVRTRVVR